MGRTREERKQYEVSTPKYNVYQADTPTHSIIFPTWFMTFGTVGRRTGFFSSVYVLPFPLMRQEWTKLESQHFLSSTSELVCYKRWYIFVVPEILTVCQMLSPEVRLDYEVIVFALVRMQTKVAWDISTWHTVLLRVLHGRILERRTDIHDLEKRQGPAIKIRSMTVTIDNWVCWDVCVF